MKDSAQSHSDMGQRVRKLRKQKAMTLKDVSDRAGIAVSTISKIERGMLAPSYDKFSKIAEALGVELSALHTDAGTSFEEGAFLVARAGDSVAQTNETYTYEHLFTQVLGKTMLPAFCDLKPLEEMTFDDHVRHGGQEFMYVISGKVTMHLEGKPPVLLTAGECVYFDSNRGHIYSSTDASGARVLFLHAPDPASSIETDLKSMVSEGAQESSPKPR
ncbi:helix-turn-helix domain-containing protein [Phaeobacter sp. SYSU ZJ3003]|uniref:helix-turn-helix domain-containing protein n=1 Tax=Phaeobacter sp. SYSU ZJ3003 TaxID=2109330 RepID=UPI00351C530B